uniref:RRM domain-containing protein n=1 Tax=Chaetoceros debilis TaxID=122233 RepID=A0A7S3VGL6_9STRA|mmetsp:Transcript_20420/g.30994  ORF Transcript_20420/g.30994 Transcript_20420/m.30994 type:complete len:295 (+) Transcript_20420:179-1063(+)|eukprot:CAMPEP_0194073706 /NCGR_PEP_ID=MMETSP0149-20130528/1015_1 /TAXON_ID=122233 /ORGANISM="Chaetoceros debilis, Strain MM31A-1" /LENGTH=294 /DNA_ID=CAMNT_0038753747 /DNA_START=161 /DNA_END=1045 /DNA_ORIENTATION=+
MAPPTITKRQLTLMSMMVASVSSYSFIGSPLHVPSSQVTHTSNTHSFLTMKVSKGKSKHSKGNSVHTKNQERKRIAGRPGSKHYMDPNKIFIGNLPFKATEKHVKDFLMKELGNLHNVESVKIISDWKTGISKGYGFIQFMDPIYATSSIEIIKGKKLMGRVIRLDQGMKKDADKNRVLFVKRRERKLEESTEETEEGVIDGALDEVEDMENDEEDEYVLSSDFKDDDDDRLFDDVDDDDDDLLDGWYEDFYGTSKWEELTEEEAEGLNREQRREAQRLKPKKRLPATGFGATP